MKKDLTNLSNQDLTLDSREVAEMVGKRHDHLLRDIENYSQHIKNANDPKVGEVENFFINSVYVDGKGEERPNFKATKKGCEFIAHKLTGQKGAIFTATYINKFHEMENQLNNNFPKLSKELQAIFTIDQRTVEIDNRITDLENNMPLFNVECKELQELVRKVGIRALGGYRSPAYCDNSIRGKVYSDIQNQIKREFGVKRYEAIKRSQLEQAKEITVSYKAPIVLAEEIQLTNRQIAI